MNIFTRIRNNIEYAYYRKLWDKSISEMIKHCEDDLAFRKWAEISFECWKKCHEIQIK